MERSMSTSPDFDLIATCATLQREYGRAPSYQQLWGAAASGRIPARREGREWRIQRDDLPVIAAHFGLRAAPTRPAA
jgi:hypothetical protein